MPVFMGLRFGLWTIAMYWNTTVEAMNWFPQSLHSGRRALRRSTAAAMSMHATR